MTAGGPAGRPDRRRSERRGEARLADLSLPELRRIVVTTILSAAVLVAFLWMVRTVVVAAILGLVVAAYLRPLYERLVRRVGSPPLAAFLSLVIVFLPLGVLLAYSFVELRTVGAYLAEHQPEVAARLTAAARRLPGRAAVEVAEDAPSWVLTAAGYASRAPAALRRGLADAAVAATLFVFTAIYIFTDAPSIVRYVRAAIPARYSELVAALEQNVRGVLYGAIYATLLTQALKTIVVYVLNLAFGVPLAAALAILSFVIGFFPIVGSWSVYLPVAVWLWAWRGELASALLMVAAGFCVNTLFISTYLRPRLAAERSRVLNFYWMLVALITGVYTFGLPGILLGPVLIGLLKAIVDTVTAGAAWRVLDDEGDQVAAQGRA